MKKSNFTIFILFLFLFNTAKVFSVDSENDNDALFKRGTVYFHQGKFVSAALDFREITDKGVKKDPILPASYVMLAKSYFMLNDLVHSESAAKELQDKYPGGFYSQWADYIIGACKFKSGDISGAASIISLIAVKTNDSLLKERSLSALKFAILPKSDKDAFKRIISENGLKQEEVETAIKPVESFGIAEIDSNIPVTVDAQQDSSAADKWENMTEIKIGLLAPLTGSNTEFGETLKKGVIAAYEKNKEVNGKKVTLMVEDVESDPVKAVMKTRKLIEAGAIAIIGPVQSETTVPAAVEAESYGIPILAPTATNIGLTEIGEYVFQLNLNPVVQAYALAEFATKTLGCTKFSVIASGDDWGKSAARAFSEKMKKNGASRISIVLTNPDDPESNQKAIYGVAEKYPSINIPDSLSAYGDSLTAADAVNDTLVSSNCIFVSSVTGEAVQIVSMLREKGLDAFILGDSGWWNDEKMLAANSPYFEGSYILSLQGGMSGGYGISFFNGIQNTGMNLLPLMKGADAYNIIINCIKNGAKNPDELAVSISKLRNFKGISSIYTFDPETRCNNHIGIVRVIEGSYINVERQDMNKK